MIAATIIFFIELVFDQQRINDLLTPLTSELLNLIIPISNWFFKEISYDSYVDDANLIMTIFVLFVFCRMNWTKDKYKPHWCI